MPFDIDWRYLRSALTVLGLAVLISAAAIGLSLNNINHAEEHNVAAHAHRNGLQQQLRDAQHEKMLVDEYQNRYGELVQTGMVGNEQRLDWVDTLQDSVNALKLKEVRYQLAPQEPYTAEGVAVSEHYTINVSRLKLELGLLHEVDLLRVLDNFDQQVAGELHPQTCQLRRMEAIFRYRENRANLRVECKLHWYTIQPVTDESPEGT